MMTWILFYIIGAILAYQAGETTRDEEPRWMVLVIAAFWPALGAWWVGRLVARWTA